MNTGLDKKGDLIRSTGSTTRHKVLIVYTGGTIGCGPKDEQDPKSELEVKPWPKLYEYLKQDLEQVTLYGDVSIDVFSFNTPLDSTNIQPEQWADIAAVIEEYHDEYAGFVVMHGTDTMVYSASALSFMLEGLAKPVIFTGSQIPIISRPDTDGRTNLIRSLELAVPDLRVPPFAEVCIFFGKQLLRGNRAIKENASGMEPFRSPNCPPLAEWAENMRLGAHVRKATDKAFQPRTGVERKVALIYSFPGLTAESLHKNMNEEKGVVLAAYGTGNICNSKEISDCFEICKSKSVPVIDVTQCVQGIVELGQYETGTFLLERGVLSGLDMTLPAALCKMMVLLKRYTDFEEQNYWLEQDYAGEQSYSIQRFRYKRKGHKVERGDNSAQPTQNRRHYFGFEPENKQVIQRNQRKISRVVFSIWEADVSYQTSVVEGGAENKYAITKAVDCELHFNANEEQNLDQKSRSFVGSIRKSAHMAGVTHSDRKLLSFDLTSGGHAKMGDQSPPRITLVLKDSNAVLDADNATLLVFYEE